MASLADLFVAATELGEAVASVEADRALLAAVSAELGCAEADTPRVAQAVKREHAAMADTLAAIRDALGCALGGEVEAVRRAVKGLADVQPALRDYNAALHGAFGHFCEEGELNEQLVALEAEAHRVGVWVEPPMPGQVLTPGHFDGGDDGEAGELRLAALLAEAHEGARLRHGGGDEFRKDPDGRWWLMDGEGSISSARMARLGPLVVVAWPGGAS